MKRFKISLNGLCPSAAKADREWRGLKPRSFKAQATIEFAFRSYF